MNAEVKEFLDKAFEGKDFASKADLNTIKESIEAQIKAIGDNSEMEKKIGLLNDGLNAINEELKKGLAATSTEKKTVNFGDLAVKAVQGKNEMRSNSFDAETKAGEVFVSSAVDTTLNLGVEAGVAKPFAPRHLQQIFQNIPTSLGVIAWTEQKTHTSGAGVKAEGIAAGQSTTTWVQKSVKMNTVAAYATYSKEFESDLPALRLDLADDLSRDMDNAMDNLILNGKPDDNIKGLKDFATPFSAVAVKHDKDIPKANIYDLIRCASLQVSLANSMANVVLMNPSDSADLDLQKSDNGTYILPPFFSAEGTRIKGMTIIESTAIPADSMYVMNSALAKIYVSETKKVTVYDQHANNAVEGMKTAVAEQRAVLRVRAHEAKAIIYIASIKAGITSIAEVAPTPPAK